MNNTIKRFTFLLLNIFLGPYVFSQNNFDVSIQGLIPNDSIRVIAQKSVELRQEKWVSSTTSQATVSFDLASGEWAIFLDATGYYFPTAQVVNIPNETNTSFELIPATGNNFNYTWQDDESYVGHATQVYINEPTEIVVLNDTVPVPSDYSSIKLRNDYGVVLSNAEEVWSNDLSYRLYKMFESLPSNPFGEGSGVNFESGENLIGVFTLSNLVLADDLEITTVDGVKNGRVGIDAFTYANPQIVTVDGIKGKFYSKRLYRVVVNFLSNFGADDAVINWIALERFGIRFMLPDQETEDLMGEDSSNFQEFFNSEKMEILSMFEELPEGFHRQQGLQYLVRRVNGQDNPIYPQAPAIAWTFRNTIEFMSSAFTGEINFIRRLILHEKAHFLWEFSFDQELKDDWIEIGGWFEDPTSSSGWSTTQTTGFVSPYAHANNPNEDMAESIATYLMNPDLLNTVSVQKYEFIRDRIMHGTRYIAMIPEELTFTVYNLFPDYTFPGKVTKLEVEVNGASEEDKEVTVKVTLNSINPALDGASGGWLRVRSNAPSSHDIVFSTQNGQALDSVLIGTTTFSKLEKSGYWNLTQLRLYDEVGNQRFENTSTLGWKLFIDNPLEDIVPPLWNYDLQAEVVEGFFIPDRLTTLPSNEQEGVFMKAIKYSYSIFDNSPMIRAITRIFFPTLNDPEAEIYEKQILGRPSTWGTPDWETDYNSNKTFEQYLAVPEWFPSGYYAVSQVNMNDLGGNTSNTYFVNDTADYFIPPIRRLREFKDVRDSIYVETPFPDYIKPELDLNNITIIAEPTNPQAPNGETRVDISMLARDLSDYPGHESGVATVSFVLRDPLGYEHGFQTGNGTMNHPNLDINDLDPSGNSNWALYNFDLVLPVGSPPGQWGMASAQIRDKAGNIRNYSFIELVRFDIIESTVELTVPLSAEITSDYVNASNVESIDMQMNCSPCEGLNYLYRIYSLTGGVVVQGNGVFLSDNMQVNGINTSGVLDGHIMLTVQVTDQEDQLVATKSTPYFKDTFYPNSYYSSSNIQNEGIANFGDIIIQVYIQSEDIGGTYDLTVQNRGPGGPGNPTDYTGIIESENFNVVNIDYNLVNDGPFEMILVVTDIAGNTGEPIIRYMLKENGFIYDFGTDPDSLAPVITLLGDDPVTIEVGSTYTDAGATATDNYDGDISANIVVSGIVDTATLGSYTLSYDVSDSSSNPATSVTRTVNVVDTTAPVITLLGDDPVTIEVGSTYIDAGATATDNYDGDISANIVVSGTVDTATLGSYTLSYDVSDSSGNLAETITRTIIVEALGINDYNHMQLDIFPNPSSDSWRLKSTSVIENIKLFEITGRLIFEFKPHSTEFIVPCHNLPVGSYILIINKSTSKVLLKE